MTIKQFVIDNWTDAGVLSNLLGQPGKSESFTFGSMPREKAVVTAQDGVIVRIQTYNGFSRKSRGGYGIPSVDIRL